MDPALRLPQSPVTLSRSQPSQSALTTIEIRVTQYDLDATLNSGQAFGWRKTERGWEGIIGRRWTCLNSIPQGIRASALAPIADWHWLTHYLQTGVNLSAILDTFPQDEAMASSVRDCPGLRLLRQDPWETLASFILSSTKQIVQIQQICTLLRSRFGASVEWGVTRDIAHAFPSAQRIASLSESSLRECKMGFRAPNLLGAARAVAEGTLSLESLRGKRVDEAREALCQLRGVGPKIANCVLLFAYNFPTAFPIDVWVRRALQELYFPKRHPTDAKIDAFAAKHFGSNAGYAQQYLFHAIRRREGKVRS